jgi:glutaminase
VDGIEYVIGRMQDMASDTHSFILDMHRVDGISESAAHLLNQARLGFAMDGLATVLSRTHKRSALLDPLSKAARGTDRGFLSFEDNDLAVEWCENRLFGEHERPLAAAALLADSPLFKGLPAGLMRQVEDVTSCRTYRAGQRILERGQSSEGRVFFIETGQVSILVPLERGGHQRVASLGPGMNFGEMVLLGQTTRTASVYADTEVRCRILEVSDFERLARQTPQLKIVLLENLASNLADTLKRATQWIAALA